MGVQCIVPIGVPLEKEKPQNFIHSINTEAQPCAGKPVIDMIELDEDRIRADYKQENKVNMGSDTKYKRLPCF